MCQCWHSRIHCIVTLWAGLMLSLRCLAVFNNKAIYNLHKPVYIVYTCLHSKAACAAAVQPISTN
jgi:hypothetical protein